MKALIYRFILYPLRQLYRITFQPKTKGVKAIIFYKNQILLIKNTYGDRRWNVPGGGIKKDENLIDAIKREVFEEVGIKINIVKKLGSFLNNDEYKYDTVTVYKAISLNKTISIDNAEIGIAEWFETNNLPSQSECTKTVLKVLKFIDI